MARTTRDLCQDCWQDANPTEYAPLATRYGPCAECGAEALVVRSTIRFEAPAADEAEDARRRAEQAAIDSRLDTGYWPDEDAPAVVNPDGTPTAFTLAFFGR